MTKTKVDLQAFMLNPLPDPVCKHYLLSSQFLGERGQWLPWVGLFRLQRISGFRFLSESDKNCIEVHFECDSPPFQDSNINPAPPMGCTFCALMGVGVVALFLTTCFRVGVSPILSVGRDQNTESES